MTETTNINSLNALRTFVADALQRAAKGELTPAGANSIANLAGKIFQSVKLELDYNKMAGTKPNMEFLGLQTQNNVLLDHDPKTGEVLEN